MTSTAQTKAEEKRAGAALVRASKAFADENLATTWRLFATSVAVFVVADLIAMLAPTWPVQLLGAVVAGGTAVRLFIFFHDYQHGAIFRGSRPGHAVMSVVGWLMMTPAPVWKQTHDYHHQNNAKMLGASIGSYPIVSTAIWATLTPTQRRWYRFARNPLTMLFGYFTLFIGGMCTASFIRDPRTHWQGPGAVALHVVLLLSVGLTLGGWAAFFGVFLTLFVAQALGAYLFYAQHNFPDAKLRGRREWTYHFAALNSSSMFDMPDWMHWFTGNIGYHHVHHLNHKIPFYRLHEAMAALPELRTPGRTTWRPSDIYACLRLKLWDAERGRLIAWDELEEQASMAAK